MTDCILIFICQFLFIFLLGIQQQNVTGRHYLAAAITSFILGVTGFYTMAVIAEMGKLGMFSPEGISYLLAGPLAIVVAIWSHDKLIKRE